METTPRTRSWLIAPCSGEAAMAAAFEAGADALILDIGGGGSRVAARERVVSLLGDCSGKPGPALYVAVAPLDSPECDADVRSLVAARPAGLVLPRSAGGLDVARLGALIGAAEAEAGLEDGTTAILAMATQTPSSIFGLGSYAGASGRLAGLAWDAGSLRYGIGSRATTEENGALTTPYALVRNLCLIGASAAGIPAIDRAEPEGDPGLIEACNASWRDGFTGKLASAASQVPVINGIFGAEGS